MITGVLIDPFSRTFRHVHLEPSSDDYLLQMYKLIDCELVECVRLPNGDDLWLDEEGLYSKGEKQAFFGFAGYEAMFAGRGLVLRHTDLGETISAKTTIKELVSSVEFYV